MNLEQQLVFLFSALGAVNGFVLSGFFLWVNKEKRLSNYFLAGLILMLSIRIIKSVFLNFNPHLFEFFIQFGLSACLLIGPFLFLYIVSLTKKDHQLRKTWWWHLLPFVLIQIALAFKYPYYEYRTQWFRIINFIYFQWFIYLLLSVFFIRAVLNKLWQRKKKLTDQEIWMLNIFIGTAVIWLAYATSSYTSYIVGALSFSFVFYISVLLWVYKRSKRSIAIDPPAKYANSSLSSEKLKAYSQKLAELMETKKPFLDPNLTLAKLSKQLAISSKELSQIINQTTEYNYSSYIADLRVEEAKRLLALPKYKDYKIAAIAYESGFNSLSSFNLAFRKFAGMTAKEFRKQC